ncbi:MAG TPA: hypothetical protein VFG49_05545 [Dyella sp.]|uniref:hypothetical protein n=1 Tax=Dyella sp. TaxID=1869338 RepID=UPI002D792A02|nr:hypothetical protein [Dyella sp.]HET6552986.1 hypothetical protein [Dyella sp.]
MATTEYGSSIVVDPLSQMRWSAVWSGWFVAAGIAVLLYGAGIALGFSAFDPHNAQAAAKGLGIGTLVWLVLVWAASLFVGGLFASWFDGRADETMGSLHGITVWGVAVTVSALWLALAFGHMGRDAHGPRHGGMAASAGMEASANESMALLHVDVSRAVSADRDMRRDGRGNDAESAIIGALLAGHTDAARTLLAAQTDMPMDTATARVNSWLPTVNAARDQIKSDADRVKHYAAAGMWALVLSALVGLLAAALGGWVGARQIHRVYHLRRYEGRPFRG